ncbi:hypothetical protein RHSIM_Rhsim03G0096700 [Rhododendron simsii]|uniref:Uncharacterized protein n=1 Tax=Rhododendron simsii TaxID=118357 RepID=A0A834LWC7_RHOSS|nr:hypothetical protein RHSIM_Rhsim03G0096700 [Rhododendron simsii]
MSTWEGEERVVGGRGGERVVSGGAAATMGGAAVIEEGDDGAGVSNGGATGSGHTPLTPTMEGLHKAVEEGAKGSSGTTAMNKTAPVGHFSATSVLKSSAVESKSGDGGIGASEPVPFAEGYFLESAGPQDILGDGSVAGAHEGGEIPEEMLEPETVVEERLTAVNEEKAFAAAARPEFSPETYTPPLHLFKPVGITNYALINVEYPCDMLLRDRDRHISSTRTTEWSKSSKDAWLKLRLGELLLKPEQRPEEKVTVVVTLKEPEDEVKVPVLEVEGEVARSGDCGYPMVSSPRYESSRFVSREWVESAIMSMLEMRKLLRNCARGKTLQTRPAPELATTPAVESPQA